MTLNDLRAQYSNLFHGVPDFHCSPGWLPILHELSIILSHFVSYLPSEALSQFSIGKIQASEALFDMEITTPTPQMLNYLKLAQSNAQNTCEFCGEMGKKRKHKGGHVVCCPECKPK